MPSEEERGGRGARRAHLVDGKDGKTQRKKKKSQLPLLNSRDLNFLFDGAGRRGERACVCGLAFDL